MKWRYLASVLITFPIVLRVGGLQLKRAVPPSYPVMTVNHLKALWLWQPALVIRNSNQPKGNSTPFCKEIFNETDKSSSKIGKLLFPSGQLCHRPCDERDAGKDSVYKKKFTNMTMTVHYPRRRRDINLIDGKTIRNELPHPIILMSLALNVLKGKILIILHDSQDLSLSILDQFHGMSDMPYIVFDINDASSMNHNMLGDYNDACFVHILLFASASAVENFTLNLPKRIWTPFYLVLINADVTNDAAQLLALESFGHSQYLTLLQLPPFVSFLTYHILTYDDFLLHSKIRSHGFYDLTDPPGFHDLFVDRFSNFHGYNLHLASWTDDFPYVFPGPTTQESIGISISMLRALAPILNFTFTIYDTSPDGMWGSMVNGSWVGMVGELWRREKDICVNVMSIVEDRFHAVDFSVPYFVDSYSFLLALPEPPPRWHSIGFPFSWRTWMALALSIVTVCIVWAIILKVNGQPFQWIRVFLEVTRALLRQDPTPIPSALSARFFGGMWWFVGMIISISYTGNLIAYITVAGKAKRMNSLKDLAESDLRVAMTDYGNFVPGALRASQDDTLRTIGEKLDLIPYEYEGALKSVVDKKFSLVEGTEYIVYKVIKYKKMTNTYFLPEAVYPIYVGWTYPKKTAWKHKFDPYLQRMVESGLCWHWKEVTVTEVMMREGSKHQVAEMETTRPLSLKDVQGILLLYGIGLVFASVAFSIEMTKLTFRL